MKDRMTCRHCKLRFGSGSYYIFCADCDMRWVSFKEENAHINGGLTADTRVNPILSGEVRVNIDEDHPDGTVRAAETGRILERSDGT